MADPGGHDDPDRTQLLAATHAPGAVPPREGDLPHGMRLGRYRIESLLGRGGMGEVYRAEQIEPVRRTVALKLLRGQALDPRRKAHFEIERQVLAQMRHPAIAQIHDADTTPDGHPFFVMEFIDGQPITAYCEARALPLRARLALFIEVCEGVQHAHQKGVIHRDLKPGNLLVDDSEGRARPKVIDFGIATAAARAGTRDIAGTPDYMSPEQAAGDQTLLDTRSDVYSLGVVLCELLSGQRPRVRGETVSTQPHTASLPSAQIAALPPDRRAQLAQAHGIRPDAMQRVLRRELDWVVARAMAFERGDRYPSAAALAEDLRRFLDGKPLHAVPPSRKYALRKFAGRHRAGLAAGAVATLALVGGLALSVHGLMQARAQRAIAEERSADLEKVAAFQQSMLESIDLEAMGMELGQGLRQQVQRSAPGMSPGLEAVLAKVSTAELARSLMRTQVLARADAAIARDFAGQPVLAADLLDSSGRVHHALGLYDEAERAHATAAAYRARTLGPAAPATLRAQLGRVAALERLSRYDEARTLLDEALQAASALPDDDETRSLLELELGQLLGLEGDLVAGRERKQALLDRLRAARGEDDALVLRVMMSLAMDLARSGEQQQAQGLMRHVLEVRRRTLGEDHPDTVGTMGALATALAIAGEAAAAVELQRSVVELQTRRLGSEHPDTLVARGNLANMLSDSGRTADGLGEAAAVAEARERVLGAEHPMTLRALLNLASLRARLDDFAGSLPLERRVLEARSRILGPEHPDTLFIALNHAMTLMRAGEPARALSMFEQTMPRALDVLGEKHPQYQLGMAAWGETLSLLGRRGEAVEVMRRALALRETHLPADSPQIPASAWSLVLALRDNGQADEADALHARLIAPLLAADPDTLSAGQRARRSGIEADLAGLDDSAQAGR